MSCFGCRVKMGTKSLGLGLWQITWVLLANREVCKRQSANLQRFVVSKAHG